MESFNCFTLGKCSHHLFLLCCSRGISVSTIILEESRGVTVSNAGQDLGCLEVVGRQKAKDKAEYTHTVLEEMGIPGNGYEN